METVDVVMLTKNSERLLKQCVKSIYENVPVHNLIVVDGSSTDGTLTILEEFNRRHRNVRVLTDNGSRGKARETGIRNVETDWFVFVDSDVILCGDWFKKAKRHVKSGVGAVWGVDVPGDVRNSVVMKALQWMEARVFAIRGGCHDILIRRSAVKDIRIPAELHTLEDAYIKEWILNRKYKVVVSYTSNCRHYKTTENLFSVENTVSTLREFRRMGLVMERFVYAGVFTLVWIFQELSSRSEKGRLP